jgi:hypothetical protein
LEIILELLNRAFSGEFLEIFIEVFWAFFEKAPLKVLKKSSKITPKV